MIQGYNNTFYLIQVAIVDLNEERGAEVERIFSETYGTGCAKFIRCDVSVENELKGFILSLLQIYLLQIHSTA